MLENYCLMCGEEKKATASILDVKYNWVIMALKIKVDMALTTNICSDCVQELENWSTFLQKTENADKLLAAYKHATLIKERALCKKFDITACVVRVERVVISDTSDQQVDVDSSVVLESSVVSDTKTNKNTLTESITSNTRKLGYKKRAFKSKKQLDLIIQRGILDKTVGNLIKHIHNYECKDCNINFNCNLDLYSHNDKIHSIKRSYQCIICNKNFTSVLYLKYHARKHSDNRPYLCDLCDKAFKTKSGVDEHKKRHSEVCSYPCENCERAFKTTGDLYVHNKRYHIKKREYKCSKCGFESKTLGDLKVHLKVHSLSRPYKCSSCSFSCKASTVLYAHKRQVHGTEAPFKCGHCNKRFKVKGVLQNHIRTHLNLKQFKCLLCSFAANTFAGLHQHCKRVHKIRK